MKNTDFNFTDFIIAKGFRKVNNFTFKYLVENGFELYLEFIKDEYLIPFTPEMRFRDKIPKNREQAEKEFDTIQDLLKITFTKNS